jgi:hypothetical protein
LVRFFFAIIFFVYNIAAVNNKKKQLHYEYQFKNWRYTNIYRRDRHGNLPLDSAART